jgi:hypothetical protein
MPSRKQLSNYLAELTPISEPITVEGLQAYGFEADELSPEKGLWYCNLPADDPSGFNFFFLGNKIHKAYFAQSTLIEIGLMNQVLLLYYLLTGRKLEKKQISDGQPDSKKREPIKVKVPTVEEITAYFKEIAEVKEKITMGALEAYGFIKEELNPEEETCAYDLPKFKDCPLNFFFRKGRLENSYFGFSHEIAVGYMWDVLLIYYMTTETKLLRLPGHALSPQSTLPL